MYSLTKKTVVIIFLSVSLLWAAFEKNPGGAAVSGLGNAAVALPDNPFAIFFNPAQINHSANSVFFSYRNYYGIPDISRYSLAANFRLFKQPLSAAFDSYGNNLYNETTMSIGAGKQIYENISLGVTARFYSLAIKNYGSSAAFGLDLGMAYQPHPNFILAAAASNLNRPTIGRVQEELPQSFSLGFAYFPEAKLQILFELFRDVHFEQDYRAGAEYALFDNFDLRLGVIDKTDTFTLGAGFNSGTFKADYAIMVHSLLGPSHAFSLGIRL